MSWYYNFLCFTSAKNYLCMFPLFCFEVHIEEHVSFQHQCPICENDVKWSRAWGKSCGVGFEFNIRVTVSAISIITTHTKFYSSLHFLAVISVAYKYFWCSVASRWTSLSLSAWWPPSWVCGNVVFKVCRTRLLNRQWIYIDHALSLTD